MDDLKDIKLNIIKNKLMNKEFYNTKEFKYLGKHFNKNIKKPTMLFSNTEIKFINAIFENHRDNVFFIQGKRYSVFFKNLVLEKHFSESGWIYVLMPKKYYFNS